MTRLAIILITILAGGTLGQCVPQVRAHDVYTGIRNPVTGQSCCDERDCKPVEAREIGEDGDSYTWRGSRFPKRQSQPSPDERYHVCSYREWFLNGQAGEKIRCLLRPSPGA